MSFLDCFLVFLVSMQNLQKLFVNVRLAGKPVFDFVNVVNGMIKLNRLVNLLRSRRLWRLRLQNLRSSTL